MSALQILEKADEILSDESKWCKGVAQVGDRHCLMAATDRAARGNAQDAEDALAVMRARLGYDGSILAFNDSPTTKFSDIKALLAAAIEDLRSKQ